jgi:hypothetical protein
MKWDNGNAWRLLCNWSYLTGDEYEISNLHIDTNMYGPVMKILLGYGRVTLDINGESKSG